MNTKICSIIATQDHTKLLKVKAALYPHIWMLNVMLQKSDKITQLRKKMETKFIAVIFGLLIGLVTSKTYKISPVTVETADCLSDSQRAAALNSISSNISEILTDFTDTINTTYNIPGCGDSGWKRVALLDMTESDETCPQQWRLYDRDNVRACGRQVSNDGSCDSVNISTNGHTFTKVCGRVNAYQHASPDAHHGDYYSHTSGNEINEPYLDGVSITVGTPRVHVWSFYGAVYERHCCDQELFPNTLFGFIGSNYFCDTSNPNEEDWRNSFFPDHLLWDGVAQCSSSSTCCAPSAGPWFTTTLSSPSTSDIEVRICGDESTANEDTPIELLEIYVK